MLEWNCETKGGEWVTEKFVVGEVPSLERYVKAVLISTQPLCEVLTLNITHVGQHEVPYWLVIN